MDEEKQRVMEAERREIEETEKRLNDLGTVLNSEDDDDESALNSDDETEDIEGKAWFEVGEHYVDKEDMWSKTFGDCKHCCSEKEYLEQTQNEDDKNHLLRLRGGGDNEDDEDLPSYSDSDEDDLICPRCGKIANVPNRMGQLCPSSQDCGQMICRACLDDMTHSREMFCPPCWQRNLDLDFRPSSYEEYCREGESLAEQIALYQNLSSDSDSDEDDLICPLCGKIANDSGNGMGYFCLAGCEKMICLSCIDEDEVWNNPSPGWMLDNDTYEDWQCVACRNKDNILASRSGR
ncbi:hypothetical protein AURANDRAFT_67682 [Aureococcus anophagefferens]|uniref:RING-type domain-containing protein n=1 Tax=Aureococcus anophagefferens TaxID=44056 RepID=F0YM18_AURAN|nr:hypothetical protein AURANDRAFT_67682 [Aureococcus anophagefferens]XP_009042442.1 hypothetical protein AURANDRAFT_68496 [Aureococcus anophagefferens]EGB02863.1 hypothetical protein AURANDRAFT_68496 [Aureococcus anophagefferens]EGB03842.1 hypothetical protein AURANDRAFT_67682 [Aureococcus anophagefferens]|eukprot:XP_009041500.1 hypothetical protein AURANDRAFT_67682 [Aureococcus anophagefferens]